MKENSAGRSDRVNTELTSAPVLKRDERGLVLTDGSLEVFADFARLLPRVRQGRLSAEMLIKAAKPKGTPGELTAVDATAGLGDDSFLLAAAGCRVTMFEYDPVIAALLRDALERARSAPGILGEAAGRMTLREEDSTVGLRQLGEPPDVVLLDPMFPERRKSALIKKKFQLLQQLEKPCSDEKELLTAAIASGAEKIIIKRPLKGPFLAGVKPDHSYEGKAIRYDCILPASRKFNNCLT